MSGGYLDRIGDHHHAAVRERLLPWFERVRRPMPWRETQDPYRIWISEVMLQQTRVDQATPYYERFVDAFPTVEDLARADLDDVLRLWEGLGYYSRARNLHRAAKRVSEEFDGRVPDSEEAIRTLPGVGPYTAAAVLSIAYGRPLAVLDGNVIRVLTRVFAISDDAGSSRTRRHLQALADALLTPDAPARFNEAVMELGATVCTPTSPACPTCPLHEACAAFAEATPERFPVTKKKKPVPHHDIAVGIIEDDDRRILIAQRPEDSMLGGLWEFPGGKVEDGESHAEACRRELREELGVEATVGDPVARIDHAYSHFKITLHAFRCHIKSGTPVHHAGQPMEWVAVDDLTDYAFPRANRRLIETLAEQAMNPSLFS